MDAIQEEKLNKVKKMQNFRTFAALAFAALVSGAPLTEAFAATSFVCEPLFALCFRAFCGDEKGRFGF